MNSSKLLRRAKYQHNHSNLSNFQFLLSSMERQKQRQNKQNHQDNSLKPNSLKPATINFNPPVRPFFEGKELKEGNSDPQLDPFIYKVKKYLSATDDMLFHPDKVNEKIKKQAISISKELIDLINSHEKKKQHSIKSSLLMSTQAPSINLGSNKALSSSYHFPNGLVQPEYVKKISDLELEKTQLESLVSQHQRANIKMYIKLNEGESEEIEMYKKQLSSLFEKYKRLQKIVRQQTKAVAELKVMVEQKNNEIKELKRSNKKFTHQKHSSELRKGDKSEEIRIMKEKIKEMEEMIHEQNEEFNKAIEKVEDLVNREEQYKNREKQFQSMIQKLESEKEANKRINSCIQSKQPAQTKDEHYYRMLFCQASILDDLLCQ